MRGAAPPGGGATDPAAPQQPKRVAASRPPPISPFPPLPPYRPPPSPRLPIAAATPLPQPGRPASKFSDPICNPASGANARPLSPAMPYDRLLKHKATAQAICSGPCQSASSPWQISVLLAALLATLALWTLAAAPSGDPGHGAAMHLAALHRSAMCTMRVAASGIFLARPTSGAVGSSVCNAHSLHCRQRVQEPGHRPAGPASSCAFLTEVALLLRPPLLPATPPLPVCRPATAPPPLPRPPLRPPLHQHS